MAGSSVVVAVVRAEVAEGLAGSLKMDQIQMTGESSADKGFPSSVADDVPVRYFLAVQALSQVKVYLRKPSDTILPALSLRGGAMKMVYGTWKKDGHTDCWGRLAKLSEPQSS